MKKPIILCVDDEPLNLVLLEHILTPKGYEVIKASGAKESIKKIEEQYVDLILLDVMMPVVDGFQLCKQIKEDQRYRNIPIVMLTALTSKEDRIKGIEVGAEDFISKPFDQGEVLARIKMLLKMKELNDRLSLAYENITNLTSWGEKIIETVNPLEFDLLANIDGIVSQILTGGRIRKDKPSLILVGLSSAGGSWQWYRYSVMLKGLVRELITWDIHNSLCLPAKGKSTTVFYNSVDLDKAEVKSLTQKLSVLNLPLSNLACYMHSDLCIIGLNYGRDVAAYDASVLQSLVMHSLFFKTLSSQIKETEDAFAYTIFALARAAEVNDEDTGNHIIRVGEYSQLIAEHLGLPEKFSQTIRIQAQLHDVGKIHTPSEILNKPGPLTSEEWEIMKQHTVQGANIIGEHIRLKMGSTIALTHHERWDGTGYPLGLKGKDIPLEGRIINIADQYDALRNPRIYKPPIDHESACRIILEGDGRTLPSHFDPQVLTIFRETSPLFEEIFEKLSEKQT